jgi:amino acid transporter
MEILEERLKKELGLLDIFCIATGAMISSGLFILPAIAFARTGPAVIIAYLLAALLVIPGLLAKAELATAMPKAGGTYFYIERTLGPAAGTFGGLANWFSLSLKSAFALMGMGIFVVLVYPGISEIQVKIIALGFCLAFTVLNLLSVKTTGKFQVSLVFLLIGLLILYIFRSLNYLQFSRYTPFMPFGLGSIFTTAGLVFVSFGGLTKVASIAEEVKNPNRNIPLGMILAFLITTLLYALVISATVGLLDAAQFKSFLIPLSFGAGVSMGGVGMVLLAIAALIAFITTANAGILSASRFPLAMSRDGLLPEIFRKINFRFKTPHISILITSGFMIFAILFMDLENLVKTASTLWLLEFMFDNIAVIIMRESKIQTYRPTFKAPLYPWLQILGIVILGFLIFEMGATALSITGIFIIVSLLWYLLYSGTRVDRQSAFVHVLERITAKELAGTTLPGELRKILIERDNIVEDRFDQLIKKSEILDYDFPAGQKCKAEDIFKVVANILSPRLGIEEAVLFNLFREREKQSSTVIAPGLAIPHIIVPGTGKFDILLVRCRKGIIFPETSQPVRILFVLAGSRDERNFHLRALAAIAQIAQDKDFDKGWLNARNIEELRDIILLAERKRIGVI